MDLRFTVQDSLEVVKDLVRHVKCRDYMEDCGISKIKTYLFFIWLSTKQATTPFRSGIGRRLLSHVSHTILQ